MRLTMVYDDAHQRGMTDDHHIHATPRHLHVLEMKPTTASQLVRTMAQELRNEVYLRMYDPFLPSQDEMKLRVVIYMQDRVVVLENGVMMGTTRSLPPWKDGDDSQMELHQGE